MHTGCCRADARLRCGVDSGLRPANSAASPRPRVRSRRSGSDAAATPTVRRSRRPRRTSLSSEVRGGPRIQRLVNMRTGGQLAATSPGAQPDGVPSTIADLVRDDRAGASAPSSRGRERRHQYDVPANEAENPASLSLPPKNVSCGRRHARLTASSDTDDGSDGFVARDLGSHRSRARRGDDGVVRPRCARTHQFGGRPRARRAERPRRHPVPIPSPAVRSR
jgi:hypothetical protein